MTLLGGGEHVSSGGGAKGVLQRRSRLPEELSRDTTTPVAFHSLPPASTVAISVCLYHQLGVAGCWMACEEQTARGSANIQPMVSLGLHLCIHQCVLRRVSLTFHFVDKVTFQCVIYGD